VAARLLFSAINDWFMLALTLLKLEDYRNAIDAARKADDSRCWRECNAACLVAGEIALAKTAGLYLVVLQDELPGVVRFYEEKGCIAELIDLLETGTEHPQARAFTTKENNLYTTLGVIYCRYMWFMQATQAPKLGRFLRAHSDKISVPVMLEKTRDARLWAELVYLFVYSQDYDSACREIIAHPPVSFDHKQLLQIVGDVSSKELLLQVADFYFKYAPSHLNEFLRVSHLGYFHDDAMEETVKDFNSVDPIGVVRLARDYDCLPLIQNYLELLVKDNIAELNNALVEIYVSAYDADSLRKLVYDTLNFDHSNLLEILTDEDQVDEMKKVAVILYGRLKRYEEGIRYAIKHEFFEEAAECAAASGELEHCEGLLKLICAKDFPNPKIRAEVFAITLLRCGDILRPDIVMEYAWVYDLVDFMMPYMVTVVKRYTDGHDELEKTVNDLKNELEAIRQHVGMGSYNPNLPQSQGTGNMTGNMTGGFGTGGDGFSTGADGFTTGTDGFGMSGGMTGGMGTGMTPMAPMAPAAPMGQMGQMPPMAPVAPMAPMAAPQPQMQAAPAPMPAPMPAPAQDGFGDFQGGQGGDGFF